MNTRLSRETKDKVARYALARYRNAATRVYTGQANHPMEQFTRHAPFEGTYAENFVWDELIASIGTDRANRVTYNQVKELVKLAQSYLRQAHGTGRVTFDGLPTRLHWRVTYRQHVSGYGRGTLEVESWEKATTSADSFRKSGYGYVRVEPFTPETKPLANIGPVAPPEAPQPSPVRSVLATRSEPIPPRS